MITFKEYFKLIEESPTMIRYGNRNITMEDSVITFITSQDDFYAFQNANVRLPSLLHIDDTFKIVETPPLLKQTDEMYHDQLGTIFGLSLGISTEDMYVRGRLWLDPEDKNRMLVSIWSYKEEYQVYKTFFENVVKKIIPNASEFAYEYAYVSQKGIDFAKQKDTKIIPQTELEKLKKKRAELIAQWHFTPAGQQRNSIKLQIGELNKKLGIKDEPFEYTKIQKTTEPSWKRRDGD
jgi:hypothetical protein